MLVARMAALLVEKMVVMMAEMKAVRKVDQLVVK